MAQHGIVGAHYGQERGMRVGISKLSDVRDRCYIDDNGCWIWKGSVYAGTARAWYPAFRAVLPLAGILYHMRFGERVPPGTVYHATCGNRMCMKHREVVSKSTASRLSPPADMTSKSAAISATMRRKSKFTQEQIAELKAAPYGERKRTAERLGIKYRSALRLIAREGVRNSSVFAWRP